MDRLVAAILSGITDGATFGLVALGIVLVYKATRVLNFAQAEIGTVAIYVVWFLSERGLPVVVGTLAALVLAAGLGAGLEIMLRPLAAAPRLTVTVATLGVATALGAIELILFEATPRIPPKLIGGSDWIVFGQPFNRGRVLALIVTALLAVAFLWFFKRTLFGLGVLAAAQDQTALRLMGLPFNRVSMFTWVSGAVLSALAGIVLAPTIGSLLPFFMTQILIPSLAAALIGGLTSLTGAFVGGVAIGILQNIAKFYWGETVPGAEFVAVFAAILVVLTIRPHGLLGSEA